MRKGEWHAPCFRDEHHGYHNPKLTRQVVELEMQLDEIREQYKLIARSTNSKAQARKLEFLQHNLEQLNVVQKQVS